VLIDNGVVALGLGWNMSELDPLTGGFGTGECDGDPLHIWSPSVSKGTN
jgi:hypothetical protein